MSSYERSASSNTHPPASTTSYNASFLVVSGGTGCNELCAAFGSHACYVLPVSDDGGSSSEIIRVLGGPSIGDIRSRLIRLIPESPPESPLSAIRQLLAFRFPVRISDKVARDAWRDLVEGRSHLWNGIPLDRKEMIRGFLVYFEAEILKRSHKNFSFRNGSVGNYFLAGAQHFFRSLPSAIFLFSSITNSQATILPVIITNHTCTLAAMLSDGEKVVGQCQISHPVPNELDALTVPRRALGEELGEASSNVCFTKKEGSSYTALNSPISRIFYMNTYGQEIYPPANPEFIKALGKLDALVYSCGSLWTSIMPCLALNGIGAAIAHSPSLLAKILLLNHHNDRETPGYTARDYIWAIVNTLTRSDLQNMRPADSNALQGPTNPSAFITHIVYLDPSEVAVDVDYISAMGITCIPVKVFDETKFNARNVQTALDRILQTQR